MVAKVLMSRFGVGVQIASIQIASNAPRLRILFYLNTDSGDCERLFFSALGSAPV